MAKGQVRGNKEAKKPKADKDAPKAVRLGLSECARQGRSYRHAIRKKGLIDQAWSSAIVALRD